MPRRPGRPSDAPTRDPWRTRRHGRPAPRSPPAPPRAARPGPRRWRAGSPTACRPGTPGRSAPARPCRSRRPPKAPTGSPPPITLPKHHRSGVTPDHAVAPAGAEAEAGDDLVEDEERADGVAGGAQPLEEPGHRRDQVHVGRHRLDDDAGHPLVERGHHVVGDDLGVGHRAGRDADRARQAEHGHAAAAAGQQAVGVPVVAAVELDDAVAPGHAAGEAHRAHGRLGPRGDQAHLLAAGHPRADRLGQAGPRPGVGAPNVVPRAAACVTASVTAGCAWPSSTAP